MPKGMSAGRPKRPARDLIRFMEANGFEYDHCNTKSVQFFTHPTLETEGVNPYMDEHVARRAQRRIAKALGLETDLDRSKRHVANVKDRQARARAQAAAELERATAERDRIVADRDQRLAAFGALTVADMNRIVAQIEKAEREMRYWQGLMTETPASGHAGVKHATHRA